MTSWVRTGVLLWGWLIASAASSSLAHAQEQTPAAAPAVDPRVTCVESHEAGQVQRLEGKRLAARALLEACASEQCPTLVREDCRRWLTELRAEIPSLTFEALTDAGPVRDAQVLEGSAVLTTQLDGQPIDVEVGLHTYEVVPAGLAPKTVTVLVQPSEHGKLVSVDFRTPPAPSATRAPSATPTTLAPADAALPAQAPASRPTASNHASVADRASGAAQRAPLLSYVLAGVSVAALGTGIGFGIDASDRESSAKRGLSACAPECSTERVDAMQRSALVADLGFGIAIAAATGALIAYFAHDDSYAAGADRSLEVIAW